MVKKRYLPKAANPSSGGRNPGRNDPTACCDKDGSLKEAEIAGGTLNQKSKNQKEANCVKLHSALRTGSWETSGTVQDMTVWYQHHQLAVGLVQQADCLLSPQVTFAIAIQRFCSASSVAQLLHRLVSFRLAWQSGQEVCYRAAQLDSSTLTSCMVIQPALLDCDAATER